MKKQTVAIASALTLFASMSAFANTSIVNKSITESRRPCRTEGMGRRTRCHFRYL